MKLQIWSTVLLLSGLLCQTYCRDVLITEDFRKLHKEIRKLQLELESIATDGSLLSYVSHSPAMKETQNQASLLVNDLRAGKTGYNVSDTCLNHTEILTEAVSRRDGWAIQFIDAVGKLGSGILDGNLNWPGSYDECIKTQAVVYENLTNKSGPSDPFRGQYCMVGIQIPSPNIPQLFGGLPTLSLGLCVPESCNNNDTAAFVRKEIFIQILMAFSLYSNATKILSTKQATGSLKAANGIRFISMSWVILGHSFAFGMGQGSNLGSLVPKMVNKFTFQAVNNASVSVDSFYVLSGLLLAYLTLRDLKKVGDVRRFHCGMFYFHRFWRLTPPYMLLLMVYVPTFKYWSDGPYWPKDGPEQDYCQDTWWTNLLYINNFVNVDKMCMPWSWYLANDMQFFLVSPILLIALYISPKIGGIISGIFLITTWTTSRIITSVNNVDANLLGQPDTFGFQQMYVKPYCRMGPYIIGILTGFILYKTDCNFKVNRMLNLIGWLLATSIALSVLYGLFNPNNEHSLSTGVSALYISVAKTAWGVAVAWVIFACATGNGGLIDIFLSWKVFIPLCAYLIHPLVMYFCYFSRRSTIVFNDIEMPFRYRKNSVSGSGGQQDSFT